MENGIVSELDTIRDGWSDSERENRKRLAGAMQLRLRQIVVVAALTAPADESEQRPTMASAC